MRKIFTVLGIFLGCIGAFSLMAFLAAMGFSAFLWGASHGATLGSIGIGFALFAIGFVGTVVSLFLCVDVYKTKQSLWVLSGIALLISVCLFFMAPLISSSFGPEYLIVLRAYALSIIGGAIVYALFGQHWAPFKSQD